MWELEQTLKYELRQHTIVKLLIMGLIDMILVFLMSIIVQPTLSISLLNILLYLLVPYNLICIILFSILTMWRNKMYNYVLWFASGSIGVAFILVTNIFNVYEQKIVYWAVTYLLTTSGWNSSIQTNLSMGLFQFPVEWNHLQTYLIVVLLQSIGIVFVSSFTLLISSFAKSPITSLSVSLGMFLLPQLLLQIFRKGILNKLLYFFPINNLNAQKTLELLSSEKSFLMSSFIQNLMVVFLFLITLKIIFDFITYRHMKSWHFS